MPAAAIIGGVASIGGAIIGASSQNKASKQAAQTAQNTTNANNALAREIYGQNKATLSPYVEVGNKATGALNSLLYGNDNGASLAALQQAPGYQFRLNEGMNQLNTGYAARGLLNSGAAQKAALRFGQDYASNEYNNRFNQLASQQGVGLSAGNALAGVSNTYANQVTSQNNANASAQMNAALLRGQTNASMWGNIGGAIGGMFGSSFG
jgi:hypothetical protein